MSKTEKYVAPALQLRVNLGGSHDSGAVVVVNDMTCFLLTDTDSDSIATCRIPGHTVTELSVIAAENGTVVSAVDIGDTVYRDGTVYNKDATDGVKVGYALGTVASAGTATIDVVLT